MADKNIVRSVNQGPMGPQGPVAVNKCIMNREAGFEPVARMYPHTFDDTTEETPTDDENSSENQTPDIIIPDDSFEDLDDPNENKGSGNKPVDDDLDEEDV